MDALVMAGGLGTRLKMGEKPILVLCGKPLVQWTLDAVLASKYIQDVIVATSPNVPKTREWIREHYPQVDVFTANGKGYITDMQHTVKRAKLRGAFFMTMGDLPLMNTGLIDLVIEKYMECGRQALSVHVPLALCRELGIYPDAVFNYGGRLIVPSGINILDADSIEKEQDDYHFILEREDAAMNINRVEDVVVAERMMREMGRC
ncbi:MAG: NTP transferase domain-containing protein [Methermicoccaceae archaeon]